MAYYYERDIAVDDDGDLAIGSNGDLQIADTKNSVVQAFKFLVATDYYEMPSEPFLGANLGSLIGDSDAAEIVRQIPTMVREGIRLQGILAQEDLSVKAVQIDVDKIYVTVSIHGQFLLEDGSIDPDPEVRLRYIFPYQDGELQILE